MHLPRTLKHWIRYALLGVLVFAQMAMAAHGCGMQRGAVGSPASVVGSQRPDTHAAMATMAQMPCCAGMEEMAMDAASLCYASCHTPDQNDQTPPIQLPVLAFNSQPLLLPVLRPQAQRVVSWQLPSAVAAAPPLSILYCCFRI